mgnify:CR=1 FL=1
MAPVRRDEGQQSLQDFFFNDTATTEIYTLSLHDALPIYPLVDTIPLFIQRGILGIRTYNSAFI